MSETYLHLTLISGPDDAPLRTAEHQQELSQLSLSLREHEDLYLWGDLRLNWFGPDVFTHDFAVKLTATLGPALGAVLGAWLHARYGRKVRLKVGEIEAEAQTVEDVEKLIALAQEVQQSNQPKVIREP